MRSAAWAAALASGRMPSEPGTTGTPAAATILRASALSFIRSIAAAGGPTYAIPSSAHAGRTAGGPVRERRGCRGAAVDEVRRPERGDSMKADADVIIVGAGHNGLAAAILLAKRGLKVRVLEQKKMVGGAAKTEHPFKKAPG